MSNADTVRGWFQAKIATGEIARDTTALNQAAVAISGLIIRLDAAEGVPFGATVGAWYPQQLVCGHLARNPAAAQQAEDARPDLIARLTKAAKAAPQPQPAADAAAEKE